MISDKIKIMMLKGEKGDEYDDTELRAEINAKLANTPYIGYTEDGTFDLPIHTINDNVTGNTSTWSSSKIAQLVTKVVYDIDIENFDGETSPYYTTATANATYTEVLEMISNNVFKPEVYTHYSTSSEYGHNLPTNYDFIDMSGTSSPSFVRIKTTWNNYAVTIVHDANDNITVTLKENEDYSSEIADLQESNTELQAKKWISLGVVGNDGVEIPFTTSATSTILVMTCSTTAQEGNGLFLCRKSMAGNSGWKLSDLGLDVNCIIHENGYIYVYPDNEIGNIAVYYQVIE